MKISVVINTFNSDRFLNQCLRSVEKFDEIVLCDMHSTDGTIAIAEKYGSSPRAWLIISLVGAFLIDLINALLVTWMGAW